MSEQLRFYKCGNDIITITDLGNGMLQCETTNTEYNELNSDGYWIAVEDDIINEVKNGNYIPHKNL